VRIFGWIILATGIVWTAVGVGVRFPSLVAVAVIGTVFGLWLHLEARRPRIEPESRLAARVATGTLITTVIAVAVEPGIGIALALGSLIPILLAMPYVRHTTLTRLMVASAGVGAFTLVAPALFPWGSHYQDTILALLPTSGLVIVYVLFELFLFTASTRLTDAATELRHVIAMSRDLAATLDPKDVGDALARHIAQVAAADDCAISTWDRENDRVVTFGCSPPERLDAMEPAYELARFPATRRVLEARQACIVEADDPEADPAEIEYLRSIGHRTLVMLPLVVRGEAIGIVELSSAGRRGFSPRQIELAELLVREAAVTFDNARLYDELRQLAYRDGLTGLSNRARLQDRVDHALERLRGRSPNRVGVLFVDLDHFKHLNDRFGHAKGDRALQIIADRIRAAIRPGDTAGRLGGDEFAILLEDIEGPEIATAVSQRLLEDLATPIELDDAAPIVGASIGYALSSPETATGEELLRNADIAMYAAKSAGRGQVVAFRRDLLETASARSELATLLRGAVSRDELQLHFQPIVDLADGTPVGVEALVRWQPSGHLMHLPADFIDLAEETGEILPIGRWVVAEGCRRVRAWQTRFGLPDLRLYVNLSARQFRDPALVPMIDAALGRSGLDAANLTLEITEGTLLTPGFETVERIGDLRALGLRLAIDDFGTGYSSLGYLHAFQIDELKIDRSFVQGGDAAGEKRVLSQAIVELGRALGLDMIAEGIETADQAEWFRSLGCRRGQGFLYAHAMPAAELDRYLRRGGAARPRRRRADGPSGGSPVALPRTRLANTGITDVLGGRKAAG